MVDYNGLENRRTERCRGFESLSLRQAMLNISKLQSYTQFYTQFSCKLGVFLHPLYNQGIPMDVISYCLIETLR